MGWSAGTDHPVLMRQVTREGTDMTQGIYVDYRRPKSKKAVKEALAAGQTVSLQATSFFGNEYDGPVDQAPDGTYFFVGPDPERDRRFYGQVIVKSSQVTIK